MECFLEGVETQKTTSWRPTPEAPMSCAASRRRPAPGCSTLSSRTGGASESLGLSLVIYVNISVCFTACLFYTITVNTRPSIVSIYAGDFGAPQWRDGGAGRASAAYSVLELVPAAFRRQAFAAAVMFSTHDATSTLQH